MSLRSLRIFTPLFFFSSRSGFMCMTFYRRDGHVIELQTGSAVSRPEEACSPPHFLQHSTPFLTLVSEYNSSSFLRTVSAFPFSRCVSPTKFSAASLALVTGTRDASFSASARKYRDCLRSVEITSTDNSATLSLWPRPGGHRGSPKAVTFSVRHETIWVCVITPRQDINEAIAKLSD